MQKKKLQSGVWMLFLCLCVAGCTFSGRQNITNQLVTPPPMETIELIPTITKTEKKETKAPDSTKVDVPLSSDICKLGLGLREETKEFLLENADHAGLIMAANSNLAEAHFPQFDKSIRVLGGPSLQVLETKAMRARDANMAYEALGYGLETSATTPDEEWRDIIGSSEAAESLGSEYDKQVLLAPGFKLMSKNETLYKQMATNGDIWILQTQQLQKNPPGPSYRKEVERIVSLIRSGNPDIVVWAQITLPPDRAPDAEEWLAYQALIADLVDGTYIGVYTWDIFEDIELLSEIESIFKSVCAGDLGN